VERVDTGNVLTVIFLLCEWINVSIVTIDSITGKESMRFNLWYEVWIRGSDVIGEFVVVFTNECFSVIAFGLP
jgi:hypothetical protein